jgi:hypothetical protein
MNGDGVDEALAFLRDAEQKLKICIYGAVGGEYAPVPP